MDSDPLEVFLKQQFQFWYYVPLLVHLGLADADMSASFVRLLRALESASLQPLMPIRDVSESGWCIKHIMLDSIDKAEHLLKLPRPSSTTMAGRIVEVAIAVTKLLALADKDRNKNESSPLPATSSLFGRLPMPPTPPGIPSMAPPSPFTDMRDEYFQGACDASSLSAESLFDLVRLIAPEAAFSYVQPIPAANMPAVVCCVVAWGLGSKAMRVPPARLARISYSQIVNVLVLSGTSLHRATGLPAKTTSRLVDSATNTAAAVSDIAARLRMMRPTPSPCPPYPGRQVPEINGRGLPPRMPHWTGPPVGPGPYASYQSQNKPLLRPGSSGPGPVGPSRPPMYRPPQPYPIPGQPRPTMTGGRGGPLVWRDPPPLLGPRRPVPVSVRPSSSRSRSSRSSNSSESDGVSDSASDSAPESRSGCTCAKKNSKNSKKGKAVQCSHRHHKEKSAGKSSGRYGKRHGEKTEVWDGSDSDETSCSETESESESDSDSSLVQVDVHSSSDSEADSDSGSDSGSDSDGWAKGGHRKSHRAAKAGKSEKRHCHKCRHDVDDFVMVRDKRRE